MIFSDLNIFTFLFFILIILFFGFLIFRNFKKGLNIKIIFLFLSFFTIFISIFGIKYDGSSLKTDKNSEILFILDVSKSMNVSDILSKNKTFSRLDFSKKYISDFVLNNPQNKYSLITFSLKEAKAILPFTDDKDIFLKILNSQDYRNFSKSDKEGTDFLEPFKIAENLKSLDEENKKIIVLFTDGADDIDEVSEEVHKFYNKNNSYFIVGVGSESGGKIPDGQDILGKIIYKKEYGSKDVISKISFKNLQKLSQIFHTKTILIDKIDDLGFLNNTLKNFISEKNFLESKISFSRILALFSFVFFVLFLIFYLFEQKNYEK